MADQRGGKNVFPSRWGQSRWVTAAQWLAELFCERRARQEGKTLPLQFWRAAPWDKVFIQQAVAANRLFARLSPDSSLAAAAVSRAVRTGQGVRCYSLSAPWLVPLAEQALRNILAERATRPGPEPAAGPAKIEAPRPAFVPKKSELSKLKGLE